jgi:hypothetical protein
VNDTTVYVNLGLRTGFPPQEELAPIVRQRVEELRDAASNAAGGFEPPTPLESLQGSREVATPTAALKLRGAPLMGPQVPCALPTTEEEH